MQGKRHQFNLWRTLLLALAFIGTAALFTSCGNDDEPVSTIQYYLEVEEEFLVDGAVDHTDRYHSPVTLMKEVIQKAYPTPDAKGNDDAVITACDQLYQRYLEMYTGKAEHLTCLIHLVRANLSGDIVKQSERIKTYNFDINPYDIDFEE